MKLARAAVMFALAVSLSGCTAFAILDTPPLLRGLAYGEAPITQRLQGLFPIGSPAAPLETFLKKRHFKIDEAAHNAQLESGNGVCNYIATAKWSVDPAGLLTALTGAYNEAGCL